MTKHDRVSPIFSIKERIIQLVEGVQKTEERELAAGLEELSIPSSIFLGIDNWPKVSRTNATQRLLLNHCISLGGWLSEGGLDWRLENGYYVAAPGDKREDCRYVIVLELRPMGIQDLTDTNKWERPSEWQMSKQACGACDTTHITSSTLQYTGTTTGRISSSQPNYSASPKGNGFTPYPVSKATHQIQTSLAASAQVPPGVLFPKKKTLPRRRYDEAHLAAIIATLPEPTPAQDRYTLTPSVPTWRDTIKAQKFGIGYGTKGPNARFDRFVHGRAVGLRELRLSEDMGFHPGDFVRVYDEHQKFLGTYAVDAACGNTISVRDWVDFPSKIVVQRLPYDDALQLVADKLPRVKNPKPRRRGGGKNNRRPNSSPSKRKYRARKAARLKQAREEAAVQEVTAAMGTFFTDKMKQQSITRQVLPPTLVNPPLIQGGSSDMFIPDDAALMADLPISIKTAMAIVGVEEAPPFWSHVDLQVDPKEETPTSWPNVVRGVDPKEEG